MNETFWITLTLAVAILIALFLVRKRVVSIGVKASGMEAEMKMAEPVVKTEDKLPSVNTPRAQEPGVEIVGNRQIGSQNTISVERSGTVVRDNVQDGTRQIIKVGTESKNKPS